ncbi:tyrosine-type recombinase/integrase [Phytomonospora sp. NPDC050363]|uniref:tyrosine-type recombinase/integrase n=1 Tax=Phytomonospora sp. NPDC050363 TaxID=3155642 RepID=UPI0033FFDF67
MTALRLVQPDKHPLEDEEELEILRGLLRPEFPVEAGWDPVKGVLAPPRDHPLLGLRKCLVVDCRAGIRSPNAELCSTCMTRYNAAGRPELQAFAATVSGKKNMGQMLCCVTGCGRPSHVRDRLCYGHYHHRNRYPNLALDDWLKLPEVKPMESFGDCRVPTCIRIAANNYRLCQPHTHRLRDDRREAPSLDIEEWITEQPPAQLDYIVVLKGMPERIRLELLLGMQFRTDAGVKTPLTLVRSLVFWAHRTRATTVEELLEAPIHRSRHDVTAILRGFVRDLRRARSNPETERGKDVWDLAVMGMKGFLDFTVIHQPWLRHAAKEWASEDLPRHRGRQASATTRTTLVTLARLSQSLRSNRTDGGDDLTGLGRADIVAFLNRLAHQERTGDLTANLRLHTVRRVRRFLDDIRVFGMTRAGGHMAGLPVDFAIRQTDLPRPPELERRGRDLPPSVMRGLAEGLTVMEEVFGISSRRITELLIDTGRRPAEICRLRLDCLVRDASGKPVLIYTDFKNNRPDQRLPISEVTAAVILAQKDWVTAKFPATPIGKLALFPRETGNPKGTRYIGEETFATTHRSWIRLIGGDLVDEDGRAFDPALVVPYAYRHSYTQRHADQGIAPDVLRDLMGHRSMQTTLSYYHVTETRVRGAVDRVAQHQFDGQGQRVFTAVATLLADEHARMRIGQVAVPFGICTEPSNVKAGGQACPYKFTCLGCGHFRSDASYLPELKSYLQQQLADRERIQAATDIQPWARDHLTPPEEEISGLRRLIRRIEQDMDSLTNEEQQAIDEAVTVIRKARQMVNLGMPTIRPETTEKSAG